jgi:hypothetical protein
MQTRNKWISDGLTSPPRWAAAAGGAGGEGGTKEEQVRRTGTNDQEGVG